MVCKDTVLPDPVFKNRSLKCLTSEENIRKPYKDNLCLLRTLALHLHRNERLEEETSKLFNLVFEKTGGTHPANFPGVCMENIAAVEDIVQADIFLYYIGIVDGSMIGKLARSVGKHSNTVRLFRCNIHLCYVSNINALLKAYHCPSYDEIINRAPNLERKSTTCKGSWTCFSKECVSTARNT